MKQLKGKSPSFYQSELVWDEETTQRFEEAVAVLRRMDTETVPLMKVQALTQCYQAFAQAIPAHVSVYVVECTIRGERIR